MSRRHFLAATGAIAGTVLLNPLSEIKAETAGITRPTGKKLRLAIVGTGGRGTSMWGRDLMRSYPDYIEFVGLCDKNEGRVETGKKIIGASCPTYTDFEKMMGETKPDVLIVTTMDSTHHQFIIRGMELGATSMSFSPTFSLFKLSNAPANSLEVINSLNLATTIPIFIFSATKFPSKVFIYFSSIFKMCPIRSFFVFR
nr:Gfo/Idh/MocA family oxidoreductase [uncultured Parabacteroides sp.]